MNKDTINIGGKTYVRQDSPTVSSVDVIKAKEKLSNIKKTSFAVSFLFSAILTMIGLDIIYSTVVFIFAFVISVIIRCKSIDNEFSTEVIQQASPKGRANSKDDYYTNPSYRGMSGNIWHRNN